MQKTVLVRAMMSAAVLAAVLVGPEASIAQGSGDKYELRRLAGHVLFARGYPAEAFFVLEELGDHALAVADTAGAIQAYHDAAWIAGDAARQADAMFDPKTIGIGADTPPRRAAQEAQRVLGKATAIGGSDSPEMAPLAVSREVTSFEVGMEVGRVLDAIGRPHLSVMVFEKVGDGALASGDADGAAKAYREGWFVAREETMRREMAYDPKQIGIANPNIEGFREVAARLDEKANEASGTN